MGDSVLDAARRRRNKVINEEYTEIASFSVSGTKEQWLKALRNVVPLDGENDAPIQ